MRTPFACCLVRRLRSPHRSQVGRPSHLLRAVPARSCHPLVSVVAATSLPRRMPSKRPHLCTTHLTASAPTFSFRRRFSTLLPRSIICEAAASQRLGEALQAAAATRILLVTDPGVVAARLIEPALSSLTAAGIDCHVFDRVASDPCEATVDAAVQLAAEVGADGVVGLGGGSSLDVAKLVALIASPRCNQALADVYGVDKASGHRLPLVLVPTTAGTGSEATPIAIVTTRAGEKQGVSSALLLPDVAILDGELTASLPQHVAAATAIDAMVHAIEAYTSAKRKNPFSDMFARQALELLASNVVDACAPAPSPAAAENPHGAKQPRREAAAARSHMLLGSCLAGMAFANAPVAAVHALAYPIGSLFHVPHGLSNSLVLPHVLAFNAADDAAARLYAELAPIVLPALRAEADGAVRVRRFLEYFEQLPAQLGLPTRLSEVGVGDAHMQALAESAMRQTRLLPNNPREVRLEDALRLYRQAL